MELFIEDITVIYKNVLYLEGPFKTGGNKINFQFIVFISTLCMKDGVFPLRKNILDPPKSIFSRRKNLFFSIINFDLKLNKWISENERVDDFFYKCFFGLLGLDELQACRCIIKKILNHKFSSGCSGVGLSLSIEHRFSALYFYFCR